MKKILLIASLTGVGAMILTAKNSDPVVMNVGGDDVYLSEFEYLYNKNNSQQVSPVTFDEYVDMFVNYKLKVTDALNAKLDTTAQFKGEFNKFRIDLAEPYLKDEATEQQLIDEAYDHYKREIFVSHIMLDSRDPNGKHALDSIRNLIVSGEVTFEDAARAHSIDKPSAMKGGRMAWMTGTGIYPWAFEKAAFDTPIGEISEVINSGVGYHLIRPEEERAPQGEVTVRHILLLTRNMNAEAEAAVKSKIDSLYKVVTAPGADFAAIAKQYSEDPGSAEEGGLIEWFGPGRMVAEFDSISFALPEGAIGAPIKTSYGYHIVKNEGHRSYPSKEEATASIKRSMEKDSRANMPKKARLAQVAKETNCALGTDYKAAVLDILAHSGNECDSVAMNQIGQSNAIAYTIKGKDVTLAEALAGRKLPALPSVELATQMIDRMVEGAYETAVTDIEIGRLMQNTPDYRNIVNEYHDGLLLYDIANKKVWERASADTEGLEAYYAANKEKYNTWDKPHFKGYVVFAQTDTTLAKIKEYTANLPTNLTQEEFTNALKEKFGKQVKVERVTVGKGDNKIIDYLGFGAPMPAPSQNQQWKYYFAYKDKIIDQPEEMIDVRGAVVTDYQGALEKAWVEELRNTYKVKINKKALDKAKK